jgi:hypothetical protein
MDLFPLIYFIIQVLIIAIIGLSSFKTNWLYNLLATLNLMLFFYGLYLVRILIGLVQFFRPIIREVNLTNYSATTYLEPVLRLSGMVFLPFFFLIPRMRNNIFFTVFTSIYTIWNFSPGYWNAFEIVLKLFFCLSVFSATYALLWFFEKLPSQKLSY